MLLAAEKVEEAVLWPNIRFNTKVAKLQAFDRVIGKVLGFIIICKLFLRIRIRGGLVEKQI